MPSPQSRRTRAPQPHRARRAERDEQRQEVLFGRMRAHGIGRILAIAG